MEWQKVRDYYYNAFTLQSETEKKRCPKEDLNVQDSM